ncbi:hypothetical protein H696_03778 [Fonticula alba]|uniref:ABC transporter domain-containing protein n=1 Tax=Fonticula alba TaxID=691883 RepID=A0A058Z5D8_FONAL|nr:hypothetical protein H696_03778 [Fonticula alba]KCV69346.1 hypothetical protein H696_03778 [Fonticula alba]|eukprot:XP_009495911.1 hypothetical protein H696_03778 [Fonticula alba]
MPERPFYQLDLASLSGLFTYGLLLSLLLPVFVNNIVHDKQERLLSLMRMSGLRMRVYWIVNYLFNYSLYCLVLLITVLVSVSFGMKMFTETSPVVYLTIYLLWGHALVCLSFLFSTLLTNSKTATMIGYLIVIIGVSSSNLLNLTVFLETSPPFLYFLYPPFAFYRSVYLMGLACIELRCMPTSTLTEFNEIWQIIICLTLQCFVMFGLTVYLDRVLPDQHGTRRDHPLFIVDTLLRPFGLGPYFSTEEPGAPTKSSTLGADASVNSSAEALLGGQADEDNDEEAFGGEDAPLLAGQPGASRQSASLFGISLPGGGAGAAGRPLTPRELRILAEASASRPFEDPDCRAERATALAAAGSPAGPGEFPILLAGVGKTYYPTPGLSMAGLRECFGLATSGDVPAAAGPKVAVADLFLAVPNGQCFGLLGPNGAGKTSLISVLTGLAPASQGAGHCFVAGFPLTSIDAVQRHIGVCPQFDIYYPDLTVEDHLLFFARLKCSASDISTVMTMQATQQSSPFHALAVSAAQSVELYPEHYGKRASELSGGMRRRLSLAIALLGDPRVVILDEPTGGLDPSTRREVWKTIRHISRNRVILLTTHSMEEAEALCGRVGVLSHGSLRAIGTPVHLKRRYASSYALTLSLVGAVDLARKSRSNMDLDSEVSPMAVLSDEEIRERVLLWVAGNFPTAVPLPEESLNRTLCFEVRACLPAPEPEGDASANGPPAASPTTGPDGEFVLSKAFHLLTQLSSLGPGGVSGDSPRDTALASVMGLVQDWNLSPASLEEVFMRIVRQEGHFRA